MSYWGPEPERNDISFGSIGVLILRIKKKMLEDIDNVMKEKHPEQFIVSSLVCLRLLGERFPKNIQVHFRKK